MIEGSFAHLGMRCHLEHLQDARIEATKALIAEVVLEFYRDIDWLPKSRPELLHYYEQTGFFRDLDEHKSIYSLKNGGVFWVLVQENQVVGCGGLRRLSATQGELVRLWLKKEIRKQGLGRVLLDMLIRAADEMGYAQVFLDTSSRCVDAIALFKQNDFVECSPYKQSLGDVFMCRERRSESG